MKMNLFLKVRGIRKFGVGLMCIVAAALAIPTTQAMVRTQNERVVTMSGIVTDSICGSGHGAVRTGDAGCTRLCVQLGAGYALAVGKKIYFLEGHRVELNQAAGETVIVWGRLTGRDTLRVDEVVPIVMQAGNVNLVS